MNKANKYFEEWVREVDQYGMMNITPRTKWSDGTPAQYKFITQKVAEYNISQDEFPINTWRPTSLRGAFHDIEAIYQFCTNRVDMFEPIIQPWWEDFKVDENTLGQTYGHTVKRYSLIHKLLDGLIRDPFGRRHQIDLWQEQQMIEDPKALPPCVFLNMWSVTQDEWGNRFLNLTLVQRSMDGLMTFSINPIQYVMLGMMICSHLRYKTGIDYQMGKLLHIVNNFHIYDRHLKYIDELFTDFKNEEIQPILRLDVNKSFFEIDWKDFEVENYPKIKPLSGKLEIAI